MGGDTDIGSSPLPLLRRGNGFFPLGGVLALWRHKLAAGCDVVFGAVRFCLISLSGALVSMASRVPALTPPGREGAELQLAKACHQSVARLQERSVAFAAQTCRSNAKDKGEVRIFVDGAFDLTHFGHMNAFRHAKALGDTLIVGVNSSESIAECKGSPPIMDDDEREAAVGACRFVDVVLPRTPYIMTEGYIQELFDVHGVDYIVHGDDPCIVNGRDVYESARKAGRFMNIPRTEGISTTDIMGRVMLYNEDRHKPPQQRASGGQFVSQQSRFLVTSDLMRSFSAALPARSARGQQCRVVYVDGAWDMFHAGHAAFLKDARALGDRLLVGIYTDEVVNSRCGGNLPIMSIHERSLGVLGCRHVDDVLLDAPWTITREMVETLGISTVARGTVYDVLPIARDQAHSSGQKFDDPHRVPKELGIHVDIKSSHPLSLSEISQRLQDRKDELEARQVRKRASEEEYHHQKYRQQDAAVAT